MIDYFSGLLARKSSDHAVVEVGGIGYRISIPLSAYEKLPSEGSEIKIYIVESVSMYGGNTALYGFASREQRDVFNLLKEVPGTGAKKALDYLDKVTKSPADFKAAVIRKDISMLTGVFGFTKKTAEKLAAALKDKIGALAADGKEKWAKSEGRSGASEAIQGLVALGYRETKAREVVEQVLSSGRKTGGTEDILRKALRYL